MFNIGGGELLVIMLIALIVLGPQRLPDAARQIGKTMGDLRRISSGFQNEVRSALEVPTEPRPVVAPTPEPESGAHPKRRTPLVAAAEPAPEKIVPKAAPRRTKG